MFEDISWGELGVVFVGGCFLVGRKDLPAAAHLVGKQVGRVVGLLQGARARADRFASQNELKDLQNELRSGLRELDAVKGELAMATTAGSRRLGSSLLSTNRTLHVPQPTTQLPIAPSTTSSFVSNGDDYLKAARDSAETGSSSSSNTIGNGSGQQIFLAPRIQSVGAVAEEEWEKQGIGFKSRVERQGMLDGGGRSGSALLSHLFQQTLIHDQHDRAVQEQDDLLRSKINDKVQQQHNRTVDKK
jgi:Sec-independent protein translocase protein TatA